MAIKRVLLFLLLFSSLADAKLSEAPAPSVDADMQSLMKELGSRSYLSLLPRLRSVTGVEGREAITGLNSAYKELKEKGNASPTFQQVMSAYSNDQGKGDVAMGTTLGVNIDVQDVILVCKMMAAVYTPPAVATAVDNIKKQVKDALPTKDCRHQASLVVGKSARRQTASISDSR